MEPLDLTVAPPRPPRATLFGFMFLPRTIDKLRAELPGGTIGAYLNHDTGFSAYLVRKLGLSMDEFRAAVAAAPDETALEAWLAARIDPSAAPALNAKLESFVASRMTEADQVLVRERHPILAARPELDKILDILEAEDERAFATAP
jgi:hypothetical protein